MKPPQKSTPGPNLKQTYPETDTKIKTYNYLHKFDCSLSTPAQYTAAWLLAAPPTAAFSTNVNVIHVQHKPRNDIILI